MDMDAIVLSAYNWPMKLEAEKTKSRIGRWFSLCPVRHCLILFGSLLIGAYFALRGNETLMRAVAEGFTRPWHEMMGRLCGLVRFSVAEVIYAVGIIGLGLYLIDRIIQIIRRPDRLVLTYRAAMTFVAVVLVFYGGFCVLWGVYYQTSDFTDLSGISDEPISTSELTVVTQYFADLANFYAPQTQRDESGCFTADENSLFDRSATLFEAVSEKFPKLSGPALRAKPVAASKVMSLMNFTGFFFPFTGEANLNTDSPVSMLPSTIAHEIAHQRGVAREDQANFVAVLACLESGDTDYCYSACLLAYIELGNALHDADSDAWRSVYDSLSEPVLLDLAQNNTYWKRYDTAAAQVTETVYNEFLIGYGEERGTKSYGACVDLLTAYYYDAAIQQVTG